VYELVRAHVNQAIAIAGLAGCGGIMAFARTRLALLL